MRMSGICNGLAVVALVLAAARSASADLDVYAESGDRVVGDVGAGGETDSIRLTCAAGDTLQVSLRAKGKPVTVRLRDVDGGLLAESAGKSVLLQSAPLAAAGEVTVEVVGGSGLKPSRYAANVVCGVASATRKVDVRSSVIGANTTAVEAHTVTRAGTLFTAERVAPVTGASMLVGPGVVRRATTYLFGATVDLRPASAELVAVGPAVLVGPLPQFFAPGTPVRISIPYRPADVARTVQLLVGGLDGRIAPVRDITVDEGNSVVTFNATRFGIFQVFDGISAIGPVSGNVLTAFDASAGDVMNSVALSGPLTVVGMPHHVEQIDGVPMDTGAAYVFERPSTGGWQQIAKLVPTDPANAALVGQKVVVDGTRIAVSGRRFGPKTGSSGVGAVWVFDRIDGVWTQTAEMDGTFVTFGLGLALQGDRLAIGLQVLSGAVFMYEFDGADWNLDQTVTESSSMFGMSIALDGESMLVGALSDSGFMPGHAYSYTHASGTWMQDGVLTATGGSWFDQFGIDVALQGTRAVIGAPTTRTATAQGSAYVFERISGQWTQAARIDNPRGVFNDNFGANVALQGDRVLIGASDSDAVVPTGGITYLAHRGAGTWTALTPIAPAGLTLGDHAGLAIAFEGNRIAVLSPGNDRAAENAGAVHIIDVTGR